MKTKVSNMYIIFSYFVFHVCEWILECIEQIKRIQNTKRILFDSKFLFTHIFTYIYDKYLGCILFLFKK